MSKHTKARTPKPASKGKGKSKVESGELSVESKTPKKTAAPKARNRKSRAKTPAPASAAPAVEFAAPLEAPEARAARLGKAPALTTEGVATHKVHITAYAFTAEQAEKIARQVNHMFTGSEATIAEISRELPAAPETAPAAASAGTGDTVPASAVKQFVANLVNDHGVPDAAIAKAMGALILPGSASTIAKTGATAGVTELTPGSPAKSQPEAEAPKPLDIPEGQFHDKESKVVVTVIGSTAKEFRVRDQLTGKEWNVPNVIWVAAYKKGTPAAE